MDLDDLALADDCEMDLDDLILADDCEMDLDDLTRVDDCEIDPDDLTRPDECECDMDLGNLTLADDNAGELDLVRFCKDIFIFDGTL